MNRVRDQKGMTLIGWMLVLAIGGFFLTLILKLTPTYLEYFSVASSLDSLKKEPAAVRKSPSEIRDLLGRRFEVNSVNDIEARQVHISVSNGHTVVEAKYHVQVPLMGNVDALVRFDKRVVLR